MTTAAPRALATSAGARPVKTLSKTEAARQKASKAFRRIGSYVQTRMDALDEGDLIATEKGTFCIVRKEISTRRGAQLSVRNVESNALRSMKFNPQAWFLRMRLPETSKVRGMEWTIRQGDVVLLPGDIVAIRHARSWFRTAAPWTPVSDAEIVLALQEGGARLLRGSRVTGEAPVPQRFTHGSVVATKDRFAKEPSVWILSSPNHWVGNARDVVMSNAMIRYELNRGTYQVLKVPEIEST